MNGPCLGKGAPPSPRPAAVKGDDADEWLTGVLGGLMGFLTDRRTEEMQPQPGFIQVWTIFFHTG